MTQVCVLLWHKFVSEFPVAALTPSRRSLCSFICICGNENWGENMSKQWANIDTTQVTVLSTA